MIRLEDSMQGILDGPQNGGLVSGNSVSFDFLLGAL